MKTLSQEKHGNKKQENASGEGFTAEEALPRTWSSSEGSEDFLEPLEAPGLGDLLYRSGRASD
jgi:hypothetical protein